MERRPINHWSWSIKLGFDQAQLIVAQQKRIVAEAFYGNTLGGFGTGLGLVGAYVLAGELAVAGGDHRTAFARYNQQLHQYAKIARNGNAGPFLAPPHQPGSDCTTGPSGPRRRCA